MFGHFGTTLVDDRTRSIVTWPPGSDQSDVVVVGHKADFLAVGFVVNRQTKLACKCSNLLLRHVADWEKDVIEDRPTDPEQDVRLILPAVDRAGDPGPAGLGGHDSCVVPGCDEIGGNLLPERPELAEFEPVVAQHTGVWSAAREVFFREIVDDLLEILFEIQSVEGDSQTISDAAGVH